MGLATVTRDRRPHRLRVIATDETRAEHDLTDEEAREENERLRTVAARSWGVAELEWVLIVVLPPPSWGMSETTDPYRMMD